MLSREEIEEVRSWVKSPTLDKVIAEIVDKFTVTWKQASKTEDREYCWRMIRCTQQVQSELRAIVDAERVEQHNATRARVNNWNMPRPEVETNL
jgi:hypothetical protein